MESNHRQAAAILEAAESGVQGGGKAIQLPVDGDAQRLKNLPRRVAVPPRRRWDGVLYDLGQAAGGDDGFLFPRENFSSP